MRPRLPPPMARDSSPPASTSGRPSRMGSSTSARAPPRSVRTPCNGRAPRHAGRRPWGTSRDCGKQAAGLRAAPRTLAWMHQRRVRHPPAAHTRVLLVLNGHPASDASPHAAHAPGHECGWRGPRASRPRAWQQRRPALLDKPRAAQDGIALQQLVALERRAGRHARQQHALPAARLLPAAPGKH